MSEQQPLLSQDNERYQDVEIGEGRDEEDEKSHIARWREQTAETLESRPWHYAVIILARISSLASTLTPV